MSLPSGYCLQFVETSSTIFSIFTILPQFLLLPFRGCIWLSLITVSMFVRMAASSLNHSFLVCVGFSIFSNTWRIFSSSLVTVSADVVVVVVDAVSGICIIQCVHRLLLSTQLTVSTRCCWPYIIQYIHVHVGLQRYEKQITTC